MRPQEPVRVLIADDEPLTRRFLEHLLEEAPGLKHVASAWSADSAIELAERHRPDVALLDVRMPGGGLRATRIISSRYDTRVVVLSVISDRVGVSALLHAGAVRYLVKGCPGEEIVAAIEVAASREPLRIPEAGEPAAAGTAGS